jgi:hypothetical protein
MEVESGELELAMSTDSADAIAHPREGVLGEVNERGSFVLDGEAIEAR